MQKSANCHAVIFPSRHHISVRDDDDADATLGVPWAQCLVFSKMLVQAGGVLAQYLMIWQGRAVDLMHLGSETRPVIAVSPMLPIGEEIGMDHLVQEGVLQHFNLAYRQRPSSESLSMYFSMVSLSNFVATALSIGR